MDNAPLILLLLVGIVVVFGLGVVVLNRRKADISTAVEVPPAPPIAKPPSVDEVPRVEEPTVAEEADEFEVVEEEETGP
ncbi:MAG: hypothetical protein KGQ43_03345, partial [Acidobacteria bacterium]|nr:hypothetical protein [Acidobacteriota bacterium]